MKNLQKLALGLTVGAMAIGFSAFKSDVKVNRFATVYYQLSNGLYSKTPPPAGEECEEINPNPCTLTFPNTIGNGVYNTFEYSDVDDVILIGGEPVESEEDGVWQ